MKCTIVRITQRGYSWYECKECCAFICSRCGKHCYSIAHISTATAICPECEEEKRKER